MSSETKNINSVNFGDTNITGSLIVTGKTIVNKMKI